VQKVVESTPHPFSRAPGPLRVFQPSFLTNFLEGRVGPPQRKYPAVSTFTSAGIGDYGYRLAGFSFRVQAEKVPERLSIARQNHPRAIGIQGDLRTTWKNVVGQYRSRQGVAPPALLTGMSPCQGMCTSTHHERAGRSHLLSKDARNVLPFVLVDIAEELRPLAIVVENVPGIVTTRVRDPASGQVGTVASLLAKNLSEYRCYPITVQFADYGIPQRRQRTLLTFIRGDQKCLKAMARFGTVPYPRKTHDRSGRFGRLPWVEAREFLGPPRFKPLSSYSIGRARDPEDPLHYVPVYDKDRFGLVRNIPPNSGRSAYQNDGCPACGRKSVPLGTAICPSCSRPLTCRPIVLTRGGARLIVGHPTSYKRMKPNLPVSTITTASGHLGSDVKIHPWENRLLSPRECAAAQTIPRTFRFGGSDEVSQTWLLRQTIGEAIPPWFTFLHGLVLRNLLGAADAARYLLPADDFDLEDLSVETLGERETLRRRKRDHYASGAEKWARSTKTSGMLDVAAPLG
jgi:DNA (cytosine-5)-methyltransferase 1